MTTPADDTARQQAPEECTCQSANWTSFAADPDCPRHGTKAPEGTPQCEVSFKLGGQWYYRGNVSWSWFFRGEHADGSMSGRAERVPADWWPLLEAIADGQRRLRAAEKSDKHTRAVLRSMENDLRDQLAAAQVAWKAEVEMLTEQRAIATEQRNAAQAENERLKERIGRLCGELTKFDTQIVSNAEEIAALKQLATENSIAYLTELTALQQRMIDRSMASRTAALAEPPAGQPTEPGGS